MTHDRATTPGGRPDTGLDPATFEYAFRAAQVPLFLEDISVARASIRRAAATAGAGGFRHWLDAHPDFIGRIVGELILLDVNDAAVRVNAASSREELMRSLDKLVVPETLPSFKDFICTVAEGGSLYQGEAQYRALDGREYHTLNRAWIPPADDARQLMVIAMAEITDLKVTQQALAVSEERYRQLIETAQDVILRHDLAGRITFVNRAGLELLGMPRERLIGLSADELLTPAAYPAALRRRDARAAGDAGVFLYETEYRHRDGHAVPVEVSSTLVPAGTGGTGEPQVLLVARDISARRRLMAEQDRIVARLRDAQKLESLGVLAGGVAHDFNNLLVAILGNAELLADQVAGTPGTELLEAIMAAGRRAAELCREMLVYAGTTTVTATVCDLSENIREIKGLLTAAIRGGAHLSFELAADLPGVRVDPTRIRQVVMNLVANAAEAVGTEGGEVVVRTGQRHITGTDPDGRLIGCELKAGPHVFCEVRDSGPGMAPEIARRACDPFFTTKEPGRGLGLSASLGIVRNHGGAIRIDSRPDQGTSVSFWLPIEPAPAPLPVSGRRRRRDAIDLTGRMVLVVDDDPAVRAVAASFLRRLGCRVLEAADGYDAVRVFGQRHAEIDVVMLDDTMPGLDGPATCRRLRVIRPDVPLIGTSGRSEAGIRERWGDLPLAAFVPKPYNLQDLQAVLGEALAP